MIDAANDSSPVAPPAHVFTRGTSGAARTPERRSSESFLFTPMHHRHQHQHQLPAAANHPHHQHNRSSPRDDILRLPQRPAPRHRPQSRSTGTVTAVALSASPVRASSGRAESVTSNDETVSTRNSSDKRLRDATAAGAALQVPRQHVNETRRVIEDLNRAHGVAERRIAAVTHACEIFDHSDEIRHNLELHHGAAAALAKLLLSSQQNDDEIRMILAVTEMVFRASPKDVAAAYRKLNGALFLQTLVRLLDRFETRTVQHVDFSILHISRILYSCSRTSELRAFMCRQPGMLDALARVASRALNPECRVYRVRILANLSNCEENKLLLFNQEGMLDAILRIAHFDSTAAARQYAGATLMEFSSAPANQVSMAHNETVLGTLVKMVLVEKSATTRECAITALQNLAFDKENRSILVTFKNGIVLEALKKALSSDADTKARRRAAGALTNLACDETVERMGNHKGLLDALAIVATKDENLDIQTRASLALTKIASSITVQMDCHTALLDALVVASLSKADNSVSAVLRVKARSQENRHVLARHPGVMDTLADICMSETAKASDRDNSIRAIMHLVNEDANRSILCNTTVLTAIVTAANYNDPDLDEARDSSVRAMERLATEVSNRPFMAHHEGLIVAVAKAVEREAQWEQQGHTDENGYLAKPLLMSLLVAM